MQILAKSLNRAWAAAFGRRRTTASHLPWGPLSLAAIACLAIYEPSATLAAKPGGGGGTPIPGVVFFGVSNDPGVGYWAMNPDGTARVQVIFPSEWVGPDPSNPGSTMQICDGLYPSYLAYGPDAKRDRWWVTRRLDQPEELYAYRTAGTGQRIWVKLTSFSPYNIWVYAMGRWSNDGFDSFVSFIGLDKTQSPYAPAFYRLDISGLELEASLNDPAGFTPLNPTDSWRQRRFPLPVPTRTAMDTIGPPTAIDLFTLTAGTSYAFTMSILSTTT